MSALFDVDPLVGGKQLALLVLYHRHEFLAWLVLSEEFESQYLILLQLSHVLFSLFFRFFEKPAFFLILDQLPLLSYLSPETPVAIVWVSLGLPVSMVELQS